MIDVARLVRGIQQRLPGVDVRTSESPLSGRAFWRTAIGFISHAPGKGLKLSMTNTRQEGCILETTASEIVAEDEDTAAQRFVELLIREDADDRPT